MRKCVLKVRKPPIYAAKVTELMTFRNLESNMITLFFRIVAIVVHFVFTFFQFMCTIEDLKEMGIPLGPRKKIAKFVKERVNTQVCFYHKHV